MKGDRLASGARSATFVGPSIRFDEGVMRDDLHKLPAQAFILKYMITQREYDLLSSSDGEERVNAFAEEMKRQAEFYERGLAADAKQADSLKRECFITPFVPLGLTGRVIVDRDEPASPRGERGRLLIPRALRKEKTMLPTTGHIIKAVIYDPEGHDIGKTYVGARVLFSPMSGTPICFNGYPTWIQLELAEVMAIVNKEDAQIQEETLEPMV